MAATGYSYNKFSFYIESLQRKTPIHTDPNIPDIPQTARSPQL